MRRHPALVAALALLLVPALAAPAMAANKEYVALNEKGMKQVLIKKSWAPGWLGALDMYEAKASSKGAKPSECYTKGSEIQGQKSSSFSSAEMEFAQNKEDHTLDMEQYVYQYKDVQTAEYAWQDLMSKAGSCAGTHTHDIKDASGKKIGTTTVNIEVIVRKGMYGQDQLIVNEDVQSVESASGKPSTESSDEISIWMYDGMAIIEVEADKFVPKQKNWVFSPPQVATVETLALVAIQRYHLTALKAV